MNTDRVTVLPCDRCGRNVNCPCITGVALFDARTEVAKRHRAAVQLARVSRRHDWRAA